MSADRIFGMDWQMFRPHPLFGEWLPFVGTIIGLVTSIIGLAVTLLRYEQMSSK